MLTDHILFFGNGIVVRHGFINGPRECYARLPVSNLSTLPSNYGRWQENKATGGIDVVWQEGGPWRLKREGRLLSLDGRKLVSYRPIDAVKLNGVYVYRPVGDQPSAFAFMADGRFEAVNLSENMMTCSSGKAIPKATGRYEVSKWTLLLTFDDGATAMLPLRIGDDQPDLNDVRAFTVISYEFIRER
ncbi:hypothetical protein HNQ60_002223 [Povalibacter uvarum]|uniref:Uncharacterized protein n=1 Tax=Povalibacter uvarum TaxID=732238 RepID=A0A841HN18_9GAMM|nr:hypothetical protein [Povalibacter uvarum]MBB6093345.1 hypothetical protein [Povalibacter uvarum]